MALAWENNPAGICEDAPCCGCCGPQGDGAFDPDERGYEAMLDAEDEAMHDGSYFYDEEPEFDDDEDGGHWPDEVSPDPDWMNP